MNFIDLLTQEEFHGAFQKLLERYNKWSAAGGDSFEGDENFMILVCYRCDVKLVKLGKLRSQPEMPRVSYHIQEL